MSTSSDYPLDQAFEVNCRRCGGPGLDVKAEIESGNGLSLTVTLQCPSCKQTWAQEYEIDSASENEA